MRCWSQSKFRGSFPYLKGNHLKPPHDPPDFSFPTENGDPIGIEATELVDQDTVARWAKGGTEYFIWTPEVVRQKVTDLIRSKEKKLKEKLSSSQRKYSHLILLIHTDEGTISYKLLRKAFDKAPVESCLFDEIDIIMPPEPDGRPYENTPEFNDPFSDRNVNCLYSLNVNKPE